MLSNLKMFANIIKQMVRRDPYLESGLSDKIPAKNRDLTYFDLVPSALPTPTGTRVHKFGYIPPYIPPAITNAVQRPHTMKVLSRKTNADLRLKIDPTSRNSTDGELHTTFTPGINQMTRLPGISQWKGS